MIRVSYGGKETKNLSLDFPIALGLANDGTLLIGKQAEAVASLWLRNHKERYFLQPDPGGSPAKHNGNPIEGSVWLSDGDRLELSGVSIQVGVDGNRFGLSINESAFGRDTATAAPAAVTQKEEEPKGSFSDPRRGKANFTPAAGTRISKAKKYIAGIFVILGLGVAFVLSASPVSLDINPSPYSVSLSGVVPPIPVGGRYLALPGTYKVRATLPGYRSLDEIVSVKFGETHLFKLQMPKLPGLVTVKTFPQSEAEVRIDGKPLGKTPLFDAEDEPGLRTFSITSKRYLSAKKKLEVDGKNQRQILNFNLKPAWGVVNVNTIPPGAKIHLNNEAVGFTPQLIEPVQGEYRLKLSKNGWNAAYREFAIKAGQNIDLGTIRLRRIDGKLGLTSKPAGATVTVNKIFKGQTPIILDLESGKTYNLRLSKTGFVTKRLTAKVWPKQTTTRSVQLTPEYGTVFLKTTPPGALLKIDGKASGSASKRLRLQTRTHRLEITKPGYLPYMSSVTPRKGSSKQINVVLKREVDALREKSRQTVTTSSGLKVRIVPIDGSVRFNVGASRREAGRRSNEGLYPVELTKSFLIGETEITNAQYRKFRPQHDSGPGLDGERQPAVSITWDEAARFLNWLSKKEKLVPAYREVGQRMVAKMPLTSGYRLPTEAEWVYAARYVAGRRPASDPLKFPWGASMPPPKRSGNYADEMAASIVPISIKGYSDGFRKSSPVATFSANAYGVYDLGGNAAEWINDFYDTSIGSRRLKKDPAGPDSGRFHVIRGSSWRHGSITELRLSYRDYSDEKRNDLGFRIARYVQN